MLRLNSLRAAIVAALLSLSSISASAWTRVDTTLVMSDGVALAVTYFLPSAQPPLGGHPAIILMHGFDVQGTAKGAFTDFGEPGPARADSGYVAIAYTVRGMGIGENRSEGRFDWFTGERELQDLREVIAWAAAREDVDGERIAIEGYSQGGLMAWAAAIAKLPVRCIVPMVSVPNFTSSFVDDGGFNYLVQTFLAGAAVLSQNIRLGPFLRDSLTRAFREDRYDDARRMIAARDLAGREPEVDVPVFMQCAWYDDIFSSAEALASFAALRSPKKIMMWPAAHGWPPPRYERLRDELTYRFYRRWLRDDEAETIMDQDSALVLVDAGTDAVVFARADDTASWLPRTTGGPEPRRLHLSGGGTLTPTQPTAPALEVRLYVANVSDDAILFRSAPLAADESFITADASLVVNASASTYQANTLLWVYDPETDTRQPMMRGCRQVRGNDPAARERLAYELDPALVTVPAGRQIEAWVKFGTNTVTRPLGIPFKPVEEFGCALFPPQETSSDTLFSGPAEASWIALYPFRPRPAAVEMPAIDAPAALAVTPRIARGGEPIVVELPARKVAGETALELVAIDGRRIRRIDARPGETRLVLATDDLPAGVYLVRSGGASTRIAIVQ